MAFEGLESTEVVTPRFPVAANEPRMTTMQSTARSTSGPVRAAFVEDLEAVADKLGLERFPLLGISQGAAVCIEYAARHPERVSGLILIGSYAAGWRYLASPEEQARREAVCNLTEVGWGTSNPVYRHIFSQTFMPDAESKVLPWFDEFQRLTTSPRNAARFQSAFGDIDVRDRLAQVKTPTIVLHSRHDQRIPLEQGRAVASGIAGARSVPLESRNHILVDYEPAWSSLERCRSACLHQPRWWRDRNSRSDRQPCTIGQFASCEPLAA